MFDFKSFVKRGIIDAVGKQPDHWVILNAAGWHDKGALTEDDLAEIEALIIAKNSNEEVCECVGENSGEEESIDN